MELYYDYPFPIEISAVFVTDPFGNYYETEMLCDPKITTTTILGTADLFIFI